jgi:hypothetical protein
MTDLNMGAAVATVRSYVGAFTTLEPLAVVPYFSEPALLISQQGIVALPTGADVERFFARLMPDLRLQGYAASEFPQLAEQRLSHDLAIVSGVCVWRKRSGEELRRFGATYILSRASGNWRIAVATFHDGDGALRLA